MCGALAAGGRAYTHTRSERVPTAGRMAFKLVEHAPVVEARSAARRPLFPATIQVARHWRRPMCMHIVL